MQKRNFLIALVLIATLNAFNVQSIGYKTDGIQKSDNNQVDANASYELSLGWRPDRSLMGNCLFFIGTLHELTGSTLQQEKAVDPRSLIYSKITISVDEWLYGEQPAVAPVLQLEQVPIKRQTVHSGDPAYDWRNVELKKGNQLLIAFQPHKPEGQEVLTKIDRYNLVVSDRKLFPAMRDILDYHQRCVNNPNEILTAPDQLNTQGNKIFSGYLLHALWAKGGFGNTDAEAITLSRLLGNSHLTEQQWRLLEAPLIRAMTNEDSPVSEATRNRIAETLVTAGSGNNEALARSALRVLVILTDKGTVDVKSFLNDERCQKLIKNYKVLITPEAVENKQAVLECQLGLKSN